MKLWPAPFLFECLLYVFDFLLNLKASDSKIFLALRLSVASIAKVSLMHKNNNLLPTEIAINKDSRCHGNHG